MLHRMTTLLSTVVVVFLAAPVLNAVFSTAARASDSCLAAPTGVAPDGSQWRYQANRVTRQRCWILDSKKIPAAENAAVRTVVSQGLFDLASPSEPAQGATAVSCFKAPNGRSPRGMHWHYHTDQATGQRCWWQSGETSRAQVVRPQVSKPPVSNAGILKAELSQTGNFIPAASPETETLVAPVTSAVAFAQARAEWLDEPGAPATRVVPAPLPRLVTTGADKDAATATFASRWIDRSEPGALGYADMERLVPIAFDDVTHSVTTSERLFTQERSLYVTVIVFLASLGAVLVLFGLIAVPFLYLRARYMRSAPPVRPNPPPRGNALRNESPPALVRPAETNREIAGAGGPSSPDSPAAIKRAGIRRHNGDVGHRAERDRKLVVDGLLRQAGACQTGRNVPRLVRQPADFEYI
jgi:hypothetical protein